MLPGPGQPTDEGRATINGLFTNNGSCSKQRVLQPTYEDEGSTTVLAVEGNLALGQGAGQAAAGGSGSSPSTGGGRLGRWGH